MTHPWDEFSKSLAESVPRRESLRRLGAVFAGAVLSSVGLDSAWAGKQDSCTAFCKCGNAKQQNQCLAACRNCNGNTSRLGGSCGSYTCCAVASCKGVCSNLNSDPNCGACGNNCRAYGETCCGSYCADLNSDVFNCGRCGTVCPPPDENEYVSCASGHCVYDCVEGAVDCNGVCAFLESDPDNCGGCGNACPGSAPWCVQGECMPCAAGLEQSGNACIDLRFDEQNCGACGNVCGRENPYCSWGECTWCGGDYALCDGECVNLQSDGLNCGACGHVCEWDQNCTNGSCQSSCNGC
jgi:hypothetical protein